MKNQTLILLLFANFALGQNYNVTIDQNVVKYELKDKFNRFDDIGSSKSNVESLNLDFLSSTELKITNRYGSGFTAHTIMFSLTKNLKLKEVSYDYWTDVMEIENLRTYKIKKADLKLNTNPFNNTQGFRGHYTLEIENYIKDSLVNSESFKGKFKTFKGLDKNSEDYKWTVKENNIWYGITNENGIFLNPDVQPKLKSKIKDLVITIKELPNLKIPEFKALVVIKKDGKIEKETIRFFNIYDENLKKSLANILVEKMIFYPACLNEKEVKSKIPIRIKLK